VGHGGEADTRWIPVRPGWSYLLHSDGVTKAMRLDELGDALALESAAAACEAIARKVEERGPDDNYTALVVRALADDGSLPSGEATLPNPGAAAPAERPARAVAGDETLESPTQIHDEMSTQRSPLPAIAAGLAIVALGVGAYGAVAGSQARDNAAAARADVAALGRRVDTLGLRLPPDTVPRVSALAPDSGAAAATPPRPPANRTPTRP
jgi:hypothetical protein